MHDCVIILAPPRSYTSVVCAMLGQHPQMYGLPELNLFVAESMAERESVIAWPRFLEHGLLRTVAQLYAGEQSVQTILLAQQWLQTRAQCPTVSVFRELMLKATPRRVIDKSIMTVLQVEYLWRIRNAFPNTRFIHLIRHPRSVGESLEQMGGGIVAKQIGALDYRTDPPTLDYQKLWFTIHVNILTFLDGVPESHKLRIRGEEILADPETNLRDIAAWLGLRTDEDAIQAMLHPEQSPYACIGPPNARFGNDPKFLREPALRRSSRVKELDLEAPLSWRKDGIGFSPEVKMLAREFGYR